MALGTLDRTPPPFFRQGPSALTKLSLLLGARAVPDGRRRALPHHPAAARDRSRPCSIRCSARCSCRSRRSPTGRGYFSGPDQTRARPRRRRAATLASSPSARMRVEQLAHENARLRALLELRPTLSVASQAAEMLYEAADPYSRKVIIDRGVTNNVVLGSPVINEAGVLGQVTRVYLQSSEVTLLTDRDAAIPVLNTPHAGAQRRVRRARSPARACSRCASWPATPTSRSATCSRPRASTASTRPGCRWPGWPRSTARSTPASPASSSRPRPARRRAPRARARADRRADAAAAGGCRLRAGAGQDAGQEGASANDEGRAMIMPRASDQLLLPVNPLFVWAHAARRLPAQHRAARPGAGDARLPGAGAGVLERAPVAPRRRRPRLRVRPADGRAQRRGARPARARLHAAQLLRDHRSTAACSGSRCRRRRCRSCRCFSRRRRSRWSCA